MPLLIIKEDITKVRCDAIVNSANSALSGGDGVDGAIHAAAGPELLAECRTLGKCRTGEVKLTGAYRLPAKYVIHAVGPVWRGGFFGEKRALASCYRSALELAKKQGCECVAFPLISVGNNGYPRDKALSVATRTIARFLQENEMQVYLVLRDREAFELSKKRFRDLSRAIEAAGAEESEPQPAKPYAADASAPTQPLFAAGAAAKKNDETLVIDRDRVEQFHLPLQSIVSGFDEEAKQEPSGQQGAPVFCENCGRRISPDLMFCTNCGARSPAARDLPEGFSEYSPARTIRLQRELPQQAKSPSAARHPHAEQSDFLNLIQEEAKEAANPTEADEAAASKFLFEAEPTVDVRQETALRNASQASVDYACAPESQRETFSDAYIQHQTGRTARIDRERKRNDRVPRARQAPKSILAENGYAGSLEEALDILDESFSEMLLRKIDEKGMTDSACYKRANIDRKLFSKIRGDRMYKPKKTTALAFAVALELSPAETKELLMKAGFALSRSNKFDIIVDYYISRGIYNIFEINEALFAFDQPLLS